MNGRRRHAAPLAGLAGALACSLLAAAAPQLKVYFAADFKDAAYQESAYKKVAAAWKRPTATPAPGGKSVVIAIIQKDGSVEGPTLHFKSGSDAWDAAAVSAVKNAAPFGALPKGYTRPAVEAHFHFEYD